MLQVWTIPLPSCIRGGVPPTLGFNLESGLLTPMVGGRAAQGTGNTSYDNHSTSFLDPMTLRCTFIVDPHQRCRCSEAPFARIPFYTAGSRKALDEADIDGTQTKSLKIPNCKSSSNKMIVLVPNTINHDSYFSDVLKIEIPAGAE